MRRTSRLGKAALGRTPTLKPGTCPINPLVSRNLMQQRSGTTPLFSSSKRLQNQPSSRNIQYMQRITNYFKSPQRIQQDQELEKRELRNQLYDALLRKVRFGYSTPKAGQIDLGSSEYFKDLSLAQVIEKIRSEGFMNDTDISKDRTVRPYRIEELNDSALQIVVRATSNTRLTEQEVREIFNQLAKAGADLHDPKALFIAVEKENLLALEFLQSHFRPSELHPEWKKINDKIRKFHGELSQEDELYLNYLKKMLTILERPVQPEIVTRSGISGLAEEEKKFTAVGTVESPSQYERFLRGSWPQQISYVSGAEEKEGEIQ